MNKKSRGHHTIPQAVLSRFCFEGSSVWYHSKRSPKKGVQRRNTLTVFKKRNQNNLKLPKGEVDGSLEDWYADNFDNNIGQELDSIKHSIFSKNHQNYSANKAFLVQFIYNQQIRSPEFLTLEQVESEFQKTATALISDGSVVKEVIEEAFPGERLNDYLHNVRVRTAAKQAKGALDHLFKLSLVFAVPKKPTKSFVVGSKPTVRYSNDRDFDIRSGQVELWTPLDPDFCIGLVRGLEEGRVISLNDSEMRKINTDLADQSISFASRSEKLMKSLSSRFDNQSHASANV